MGKKRKYKNLSLVFGIKIGIEVLVLIGLLELISLVVLQTVLTKTNTNSFQQQLSAHAQGLVYRNSKFMQQLRYYTHSDLVKSKGCTTELIAEFLVNHAKVRSDDFTEVIYVDVKTGMGYTDLGRTMDMSNSEMFKRIVDGQLTQYISNPFMVNETESAYYVCKSVKKSGEVAGFFAATISHETLDKAISSIQVADTGYAFLLEESGKVMAINDPELVMKANFLHAERYGFEGMSDIALSMICGENSVGQMSKDGVKYLVVYQPISGTTWYLGLCAPVKEIYASIFKLAKIQIIIGILIATFFIISADLSIHRYLKPLKELNENIREISTGNADLTQRLRIKTNDDIGLVTESFNTFLEKLQSIMSEVKESKENLTGAGSDLINGMNENSYSVSQILSNINNVKNEMDIQACSVDETAGAVNQIASNITSLENMIQSQAAGVSEASAAVEEMMGNISSVNSSVDKMANSFEDLEKQANSGTEKQKEMNERIASIEEQSATLQSANKIIQSIASQTNLLAMNAAIEAAHAGEAGRGFSVVADEIRKLSETSTAQSKKIGHQLKLISESIESVVQTSQDTQATFNSVSSSIHKTDELVQQIKAAMEEQNIGSQQIIETLHSMSDSTTEVKTASLEMSNGNKSILDSVNRLKSVTMEIQQKVKEMTQGANQIVATGDSLNEISGNMNKAITQIGEQIDSFQV